MRTHRIRSAALLATAKTIFGDIVTDAFVLFHKKLELADIATKEVMLTNDIRYDTRAIQLQFGDKLVQFESSEWAWFGPGKELPILPNKERFNNIDIINKLRIKNEPQ